MRTTRSAAAKAAAGPTNKPTESAEHADAAKGGPKARKSRQGTTASTAAAAAAADAEEASQQAEGAPRAKRHRKAEVTVPELAGPPCFPTGKSLVRVGTSGWQYKHWRGPDGFYGGLPQRLEWERYAQEFDMVEINATFCEYRFPKEDVWDSWKQRAAAARSIFKYAIKAPQLYSHRKRLNVDENFVGSWTRFWASCQRLRPHLGPVLFQFPANFRTTAAAKGKGQPPISNIDRLRRLGEVLPAGERFVFEFRDASWFCREVYDVLARHNWCLAITVLTDLPHNRKREEGSWIGSLTPGPNPPPEEYPLHCCSWGVYVRFHGSTGQYQGAYGAAEMATWAGWAHKWAAQGRETWFAFNNDNLAARRPLPAAVLDCRDLAAALRQCKLWH